MKLCSKFFILLISISILSCKGQTSKNIKDIDPKQHFFMHCAGGYRSMIAASILQARGYRNFTEIAGGYKAGKVPDAAKNSG